MAFSKRVPDRVILVSLDAIGFNELMVANDVICFGVLVVYNGATLSANLEVVDIKLSELNFWVSLSFAVIKCLDF